MAWRRLTLSCAPRHGMKLFSIGTAEYAASTEGAKSSKVGRIARIGGGILIYGATAALAFSIFDDVLIYEKCSRKAMEVAAQDPRMKSILGERIQRGPWYEASLGTAHKGMAVSCTFSVYGDQGSFARVRLKAIREVDSRNTLVYNIIGPGQWQLLLLEAVVQPADNETTERVNLMENADNEKTTDVMKPGDQHKA